jgi:Uma2 family endonuclease
MKEEFFRKERCLMNWQEVCEHPDLQNLPFKIELDEKGKIIMSPVKVYHSVFQGEIAALLKAHRKDGKVLTECAIWTHRGTKVADVAWASAVTFQHIKDEVECSMAPDVCIEVLSSSNTEEEIADKKSLYFSQGAKEVWICNQDGEIRFYMPGTEAEHSKIFPTFSGKIAYDD